MGKIKNMRAFQDGNRLVIVVEDTDEGMLSLIKSMLNGSIPSTQHLAPPPAMEAPKVETDTMKEILPAPAQSTPKFIRKYQEEHSADVDTESMEGREEALPANEEDQPADVSDLVTGALDKDCSSAESMSLPCEEDVQKKIAAERTIDIRHASYFEIKNFLYAHRDDVRLQDILYARARTRNVNFVLNVKPEKELKEIARQLIKSQQEEIKRT